VLVFPPLPVPLFALDLFRRLVVVADALLSMVKIDVLRLLFPTTRERGRFAVGPGGHWVVTYTPTRDDKAPVVRDWACAIETECNHTIQGVLTYQTKFAPLLCWQNFDLFLNPCLQACYF
jgi:hypothetical protein